MRTTAFASRNTKEILRDPVTLFFGLGFPLVLLVLLSAINSSIPEQADMKLFHIESLGPGISVFGLSFLALFSSMLIAKDRATSFMLRLFTSPIRPSEFILGYTIPMVPMALAQSVICYAAAMFYGLEFSADMILAIVVNLPVAIVFIALGLLFGGFMVDEVCEPIMSHSGNVLQFLFGTGKGSGAALMLFILGVIGTVMCLMFGHKLNKYHYTE